MNGLELFNVSTKNNQPKNSTRKVSTKIIPTKKYQTQSNNQVADPWGADRVCINKKKLQPRSNCKCINQKVTKKFQPKSINQPKSITIKLPIACLHQFGLMSQNC